MEANQRYYEQLQRESNIENGMARPRPENEFEGIQLGRCDWAG